MLIFLTTCVKEGFLQCLLQCTLTGSSRTGQKFCHPIALTKEEERQKKQELVFLSEKNEVSKGDVQRVVPS